MQAFGVQLDIAWEDPPANYAKVDRLVAEAAPPAGSLIVLPEMFATGFSMNVDRVAEPREGPTYQYLAGLARQWKSYVVGGVATISDGDKPTNEALVFDPAGNERARYEKQQPFTLGGERDHYRAGSHHLCVPCENVLLSPLVCYDLRFPELFRPAAKEGAQVFAVIANWPRPRDAHWTALLRARAIENQAFVVGVNRCGNDPRLTYRGQSLIIDPHGQILAEAAEEEQVIHAELDIKDLIDYRRKFPALSDMH